MGRWDQPTWQGSNKTAEGSLDARSSEACLSDARKAQEDSVQSNDSGSACQWSSLGLKFQILLVFFPLGLEVWLTAFSPLLRFC